MRMENLAALNLKNLDKSQWKTYRFDEIAKNISERVDPNNTDLEVYVGLEHIDSESIHLKRSGTPDDVDGQKLRFYPGDLIFGRRRAYQRKAAVATTHGFCSAHALVLRANPEVIDPQLFPFFMHSDAFMHRAVDISVGSLSPTINWGTLKHQNFQIPPVSLQLKITNLLWEIEELERLNLDLIFKFSALGSRKLNKIYVEKSFKKYEMKSLSDISLSITKGTTPTTIGQNFITHGINFIKVESLSDDGSFLHDKFDHIDSLTHDMLKRSQLETNDILFSIAGALGRCAVVTPDICPANTNQALSIIRLKNGVNPLYVYYYLKTSAVIKLLDQLKVQGAQPNLSLQNIRELSLPLPSIEEQEKVVLELFKNEQIMGQLKSKLIHFQKLKKTILNQFF
jgi:type I restriction enzyme, S subunit